MKSLEQLEQNIETLLTRYRSTKATCDALRADNLRLNTELREAHAEIVALQKRQKQLQTVLSMLQNEGHKTKAYQEITYLIGLVDKALESLHG